MEVKEPTLSDIRNALVANEARLAQIANENRASEPGEVARRRDEASVIMGDLLTAGAVDKDAFNHCIETQLGISDE